MACNRFSSRQILDCRQAYLSLPDAEARRGRRDWGERWAGERRWELTGRHKRHKRPKRQRCRRTDLICSFFNHLLVCRDVQGHTPSTGELGIPRLNIFHLNPVLRELFRTFSHADGNHVSMERERPPLISTTPAAGVRDVGC